VNHDHDLIDTTEMYLRSVLELEEEGAVPLRARIAERLGQSVPTVSQKVARMERDGLVTFADDRRIQLTPAGRAAATRVMRKHRLAECLLSDILGLDWQLVHDEACRWEHVMSEAVELRVLDILGHPTESPYGNPIPGLAELGDDEGDEFLGGMTALTQVPEAAGSIVVRRIGEPIQSDTVLLTQLRGAGFRPNAEVPVSRTGGIVRIGTGQQGVELDAATAAHVFVTDVRLPQTSPMALSGEEMVRANTRLRSVALVPEIRLHQASEPIGVWQRTERAAGRTGLDPPFWAFAWAGGQALARYLLDHPETVKDRQVIDIASGSGLVAIAAARAGAAAVTGYDIDPLAIAAITLNAAANDATVLAVEADILDTGGAGPDVMLVADAFYERELARRVTRFAERCRARGADVLVGDFGRAYLPRDRLAPLAAYDVPGLSELEDSDVKRTTVWEFARLQPLPKW